MKTTLKSIYKSACFFISSGLFCLFLATFLALFTKQGFLAFFIMMASLFIAILYVSREQIKRQEAAMGLAARLSKNINAMKNNNDEMVKLLGELIRIRESS